MIRIGRLSLHLPHGFKGRAAPISRRAGEALAVAGVNARFGADTLTGLRIQIRQGATDAEIGRAIANAILERTGGPRGGGDA